MLTNEQMLKDSGTIYFQLLKGMWVPGVSRGLHCGQPAPRSSPMDAGKSLQTSHGPPFHAPITLKHDEPVEGD